MGSGIVAELINAGAKCWVTARNENRLDQLKRLVPEQLHSNLGFFKADLTKENECLQLKEEILNREGKLNHVVASIGGWRTDGLLGQLSVDNYQKAVQEMTLPHFVCYKTFAKLLSEKPNSTYTFIAGLF